MVRGKGSRAGHGDAQFQSQRSKGKVSEFGASLVDLVSSSLLSAM